MLMKRLGRCRRIAPDWLACLVAVVGLAACSTPTPPNEPGAPSVAAAPQPLPPAPWRDTDPLPTTAGRLEWTDAGRDRTIVGQWTAPTAGAQALILVLPGLAQATVAPPALVDALAGAGFAVVTVGHPGNDAAVWQGPDARRADFTQAARRMYSASEAAERAADVRFVLDALERQPLPVLSAPAARRIGAVGIGLGSQTLQLLLGEPMVRSTRPVPETRISAAALLGPYVGFEGPAMHQRYTAIVTPLLVAYGLVESDPFGLGMTSQQRRAMVGELRGRVTELRLPTASLVGALAPGAVIMPPGAAVGAAGSAQPRGEAATRATRTSGAGGAPQGSLLAQRPMAEMTSARPVGVTPGDRAARVALLLGTQAFFEAELLGNADARDWLEGPHPGPVQWTTYPAGRAR